jgi:hypothetical protein
MPKLTRDERDALKTTGIFSERPEGLCVDCGGYHLRTCPRIKRQVWIGNGNRTEVEYWEHWDESQVIFTEDVFETDDEEPDA